MRHPVLGEAVSLADASHLKELSESGYSTPVFEQQDDLTPSVINL